jgi:maltose alpha-D-glucosyltransferase/alpha-amylase
VPAGSTGPVQPGKIPAMRTNEEHTRALIELFTLEKALYEIRYELDNRPDWVGIPIGGVLDLLGEPSGEERS